MHSPISLCPEVRCGTQSGDQCLFCKEGEERRLEQGTVVA